ncbi:hypothetical protein VTN49DRAFT_3961 [Thermomyces lanuginosus]|uniref:uncharacterized protein n=1 Tax=Thermomyces lanuginosus TaxID=5541 RepID=UPI003744AF63
MSLQVGVPPPHLSPRSAHSSGSNGSVARRTTTPSHKRDYEESGSASDLGTESRERSPLRRRFRDAPVQGKVIYAAGDIKVVKRTFSSLREIPRLPKNVPYAPKSPAQYAESSSRSYILHASFDYDELAAILALLARRDIRCPLPDAALPDQVIHTVQSAAIPKGFTRWISNLNSLNRLLKKNNLDGIGQVQRGTKPKWVRLTDWKIITELAEEVCSSDPDPDESLALATKLKRRQRADIRAFWRDAREGVLPSRPYYITCVTFDDHVRHDCDNVPQDAMRYLRRRERGLLAQPLRISDRLRRTRTWKGASNGVINVALSPDGTRFAAGAAAHCDDHNMQYNRSNNLLLGNLISNTIHELPGHRVPRGADRYSSDPFLYMSVTAVEWHGDRLYTSSYDRTVKIWDVSSHSETRCLRTLNHNDKVEVMARSLANGDLLATGTDARVGLWRLGNDDDDEYIALDVSRFRKSPIKPSSIAWGIAPLTQDLFVAGFCGADSLDNPWQAGQVAMWKICEADLVQPQPLIPYAQAIFDLKFHPTLPWLVTGTSRPSGNEGARGTRSLVRIYDPLERGRSFVEMDCPALDINDVSFCPMDRTYVSASCTDGTTYVWDWRYPGQILHRLKHGRPLNQLDESVTREQADVGVRVALWGDTMDRFITGSSDGVLKAWNVLLSPEDAHVRDIAEVQDEILSAAFSEDKSTLVIGDGAGAIHVLSLEENTDEVETIRFERESESTTENDESGATIAAQMLSSGELVRHPIYGVGQGPAYRGPYAAWARPPGTTTEQLPITPLTAEIQALQLDGPDVEQRVLLDAASKAHVRTQRELARMRNATLHNERKRKRPESEPQPKPVFREEKHPEPEPAPTPSQRAGSPPRRKPWKVTHVIDLCSSDEEGESQVVTTGKRKLGKEYIFIDLTSDVDEPQPEPEPDPGPAKDGGSESDDDDHWWPPSEEILRLSR